MDIIAHLNSNAVRYLRVTDSSGIFIPDLVAGIKERYSFWRTPNNPEEFNLETGAIFSHGLFQKTLISSLRIYSNGVVVESNAKTSVLDELIDDYLVWAQAKFNHKYVESAPVVKQFSSSIEVRSSLDFSAQFDKFQRFSQMISAMVAGYGFTAPYEIAGLIAQSDTTKAKPFAPRRFVFERRNNAPYEENIFYTEAPVSTDQHLELLTELENSF